MCNHIIVLTRTVLPRNLLTRVHELDETEHSNIYGDLILMGCGRFCQNLFSLFYGDFLFLSESDYSVPYFQTADKLENSLKAIPNIKHSFCQAQLQDVVPFD